MISYWLFPTVNIDGLELEVIAEDSAGLSQFVLVAYRQ